MRLSFVRLGAIHLLLAGVLTASVLTAQQTATLAGTVVTADSSRAPVRRAIVTIAGVGQQSRGTVTDDNGRFRFAGLAPGRFTLTVSKPAYLPATYGATPTRPNGVSIDVAAGVSIPDLVVPIARGAAISGVVRDSNGEPVTGVGVVVMGRISSGFARALDLSRVSAVTDDRGSYRIYGLPAGEYAIAIVPDRYGFSPTNATMMTTALVDAALREQQRRTGRASVTPAQAAAPTQSSRSHGYVPIFYPGTPHGAETTWVTLSGGEERTGLDMVFSLVPVATIEGVLLGVDGVPTSTATPDLISGGPQIPTSLGGDSADLALRPGADGKFRFTGVAPGHYALVARTATGPPDFVTGGRGGAPARGRPTPPETPAWASTEIDVTGDDITGIVLKLQPAMTLAGKVAFTGPPPAADVLTQLRVSMTPLPVANQPTVMNGVSQGISPTLVGAIVRADATFELRGLMPGLYRLGLSVPAAAAGPTSLWARSATLEGRELLDAPIEIKAPGDISDVILTLSDLHTELSGTLQDASGRPDTDDAVIVFPADRALWQPPSRRIRSMRPNASGRFSFPDLPPGDYILATLTDASGTDWQKPESLAQIVSVGVKVTIGEGERKTQDLRAR